jgi:hypothetical protein
MWRAALVGLIVTGATSCGSKTDDGPAIVAGAPVGTVVEVEGTVTANGKPLAVGAAITADDLVETSDNGRIAIELAHNHVRWVLGANKREKARDSKAWRVAKAEGSAAAVDQIATSAGRDGERRAAETDVTTSAPAPASGSATRAPVPAEPTTPPVAAAPADRPSPPKIAAPKRAESSPTGQGSAPAPGGAPPPVQPATGAPAGLLDRVMDPAPHTRKIITSDAVMAKCVKPGATAHLVITCTEKTCTLATTGPAEACLRARFGKLQLPKASYTVEVELTGPAR